MRRDLCLCPPLEVLQADDLPLVVTEGVDRGSDTPDRLQLLGAGWELHDRRIVVRRRLEGVGRPTALVALHVDRGATGDGRQPRCEVTPGLEAVRVPPRLQEGLLGDVLGPLAITEHPHGHGEHEPAVALVQRPHGALVAIAQRLGEGRVLLDDVWGSELVHSEPERTAPVPRLVGYPGPRIPSP